MNRRTILVYLAIAVIALMIAVGAVAEQTDATGQWKYILEDGNATITGNVEEPSGELVVPEVLDGHPVTGIGAGAFQYCNDLTRITLPNSVTTIGGEAFDSCWGLMEIILPDSLTSLGAYAFAGSALQQIILPDSLTIIAECTFYKCEDLSQVTLPKGLILIDSAAFMDTNLTEITLPGPVVYIAPGAFSMWIGNTLTIYAPAGSWGERYAEEMKEYDDVRFVPVEDSAASQLPETRQFEGFRYVVNEDGKTVTIREFVDKTADWVTIPNDMDGLLVTAIGVGAFAECAMKGINLPDSLVSIGDYAFCHSALKEIALPGSLVSIGEHAFYDCDTLPLMYLPTSVTHIGRYAFSREGHGDTMDMIIHAPAGSYAEGYARQNRLPLVITD